MKQLTILLLVASGALAQVTSGSVPNDVPSAYTSLYQLLQSNIAAFAAMIPAQNKNQPTSTLLSGDLLSANGNTGLKLLTAAKWQDMQDELARLKSVGQTAVTVTMGLPLMNEDFYKFNGDPQDFQSMVTVFQNLQKLIHQNGMKMIAESADLFPGYFSENSGFNLTGYYASLSDADFVAARAKNVLTIAQQVGPDYINLNSEPDTDNQLTGRPNLYGTPQAFVTMNDTIIAQVRAAGVKIPIGAGVGTWLNGQAGATDWVQALVASSIDYLDLHIYATNYNFLPNAITYADIALQAGKKVAISECWDFKETNQEFAGTTVATEAEIYARDTFSFFAPVDSEFVEAVVNFANWKGLIYVSPFFTRYYWTYLNYKLEPNATLSMDNSTAEQVINDATLQFVNAIKNNTPPTFTGLSAKGALAGAEVKAVTSVSAASYATTMAPSSIVSLFAANISTQNYVVTTLPLPTNISGITATITDISGNATPLSLIAVTPGQINAVLPASLQAGPAVVNLTTSTGAQITGDATLAVAAPSLFSANETGRGTAAAQLVIGHADGSQTFIPSIASCPSNGCDIGSSTDQAVLVLYGTGIRGAGGASAVTATVGNTPCQVAYAGAQSAYVGLDQVNVKLPHSLAGSGTVNVTLKAAGQTANTVTITIQ
jgi:uncharacterized protein (TIGR03437 family)